MFTAGGNIQFEVGAKTKATRCGGIGVICRMVMMLGLARIIDERVHVLKCHQPYHESDHVLNIAYNLLAGGHCLEDIEQRRNDEAYLDSIGADVIPDPTTAGDFCRRFDVESILELQQAYDEVRLKVWQRQPKEFFERAIIEADGTLVSTDGQCKEGMEFSYKGVWGCQPEKCERPYRMIVLRKNISREKGEARLIDEIRYFFYITNDMSMTPEQVIFFCNDRCNQENLIEQLKNGVRALKAPSNTLESNWAYMTMAMLAWCLKAWMALLLPEPVKSKPTQRASERSTKHERCGQAAEKRTLLRMEFRQFVDYLICIPGNCAPKKSPATRPGLRKPRLIWDRASPEAIGQPFDGTKTS